MQVKFTPQVCLGETPLYTGTVTLRVPTVFERQAMRDECGLLSLDLDVTEEEKLKIYQEKTRLLYKVAMREVEKHFVAVDLVRKEDGYRFDTWEKIIYDSDLGEVLVTEMATRLVSKYEVGKDSTSR